MKTTWPKNETILNKNSTMISWGKMYTTYRRKKMKEISNLNTGINLRLWLMIPKKILLGKEAQIE